MNYDGVDDRYLGIAYDIINGGYTPLVEGCNVTLKKCYNNFAWYLKGTEIMVERNSQLAQFKKFNIEKMHYVML